MGKPTEKKTKKTTTTTRQKDTLADRLEERQRTRVTPFVVYGD